MRNIQTHPIKAWRRAGVPLGALECADPAACIANALRACNGKLDETPLLEWDCVRGITGRNQLGKDCLSDLCGEQDPGMFTNPTEAFAVLAKVPRDSIVFAANVPKFIDNPTVMQALWNARDVLKGKHALMVLLGSSFRLPEELRHDVMIYREALPTPDEVREIIGSVSKDAGVTVDEQSTVKAVDALRGLSAFEAEQVLATSLTKAGVDENALWDRKIITIQQTDGLTVYRNAGSFADIGGLQNGKKIMAETIKGKMGITCLVLLDELDKALSASGTDTSGTTQDQNKVLLSYMQDNNIAGMLWLGPPGTGKTQLAKSAAGECGIPLIMLDLGALKGSLVGQSEQQMRAAINIIHAVSDGRALFIGACNRTENLLPELRRRFNYLSMFFDLPDKAERESAWRVWMKSYKLTPGQCDEVDDQGWTGSEIRNCCLKAWAMDRKLSEAATTIVPISKSASDIVQGLRKAASNKYISASHPGLYTFTESNSPVPQGRKIDLG